MATKLNKKKKAKNAEQQRVKVPLWVLNLSKQDEQRKKQKKNIYYHINRHYSFRSLLSSTILNKSPAWFQRNKINSKCFVDSIPVAITIDL